MTWTLWLLFVCTLPLPYFMIETGRVPALQLFLLAALTAPLVVTDPSFTTRFVAGLFVGQSLLYGALLYGAARLAARAIQHTVGPRLGVLVIAVLAIAVGGAGVLLELYRAPLSHGPGRTTLVGVFCLL